MGLGEGGSDHNLASMSRAVCARALFVSTSATSVDILQCPSVLFQSARIPVSFCTRYLGTETALSQSTCSQTAHLSLERECRWPQVGFTEKSVT